VSGANQDAHGLDATMKFSSEFPAATESFFLALLQEKDHWTAATLRTVNYVNHNALFIGLSRKSSAEAVSWEGSLFSRAAVTGRVLFQITS
jgi:hypothetical protein